MRFNVGSSYKQEYGKKPGAGEVNGISGYSHGLGHLPFGFMTAFRNSKPESLPPVNPEQNDELALTPQQRRLTEEGRLTTYRKLIVDDRGFGTLFGFEMVNLLFGNMPGLAGLVLRSHFFSYFFEHFGHGSVLGRGVTVRQPSRIAIGKKVIVDEFASLMFEKFTMKIPESSWAITSLSDDIRSLRQKMRSPVSPRDVTSAHFVESLREATSRSAEVCSSPPIATSVAEIIGSMTRPSRLWSSRWSFAVRCESDKIAGLELGLLY